ncbi:MAG: ABC transporter substrate-binding protein [Gammaproteobacteria bacterium]|nr:ABC transporter substrate-binding protein [Gammaproteobacteria bacterium]
MNIKKTALIGVTLLTLSTAATLSAAQNYSGPSYQDRSYQGSPYQDQSSSQYPVRQGNYYSQSYRPEKSFLPPAKVQSPAEMLEYSIKKVLAYLSRPQNASLEQITGFLKREITPNFDFEYMARWVAGRYYKLMSPKQKQQFTETFSELFITTFVQKLSNYQNYPPVVSNFRSKRTSDKEALASARILQEDGGSIKVDFKFLKTKRGWKVVDVKANGVSALFYYRNFFNEQIRRRNQQQAVFQ